MKKKVYIIACYLSSCFRFKKNTLGIRMSGPYTKSVLLRNSFKNSEYQTNIKREHVNVKKMIKV